MLDILKAIIPFGISVYLLIRNIVIKLQSDYPLHLNKWDSPSQVLIGSILLTISIFYIQHLKMPYFINMTSYLNIIIPFTISAFFFFASFVSRYNDDEHEELYNYYQWMFYMCLSISVISILIGLYFLNKRRIIYRNKILSEFGLI
jgi:hypothetical protein